jgi:hypothetical protein
MSTFKKIWEDAWSARMEYILTNTLLALLEAPNTTLLGVNRMLSDKDYRKEIVSHVQDPSVKAFWVKEFANYTERMAAEAVPAIQNKVGQFTANPLIRNMIGQVQSSFDFREAMDRRKIIIINLSKGRIGDENMKLLGGLLVTKIYLAAMSRADVPDRAAKMLPNFYLFVDEFQNFANASFADILSEARKYKLNLTIAHQYVEQMDEIVRPAVFGNVGTMIAFRVGATDAELLEKEFAPVFTMEDLVNLGFAQIYLKLMIDGLSSQPFSATTLPPIEHPDISYVKEIIDASREQYARPRAMVEEMIVAFHEPTPKTSAQKNSSSTSSTAKKDQSVNQSAGQSISQPVNQLIPQKNNDKEKVLLDKKTEKKELDSPQNLADLPKPIEADHLLGKNELNERKNIENVPKKPANNVVNQTSHSSTHPPVNINNSRPMSPAQNRIQPVSLSSLANKKPKIDHKVQTQKNVNDLKSALSAVLAKAKEAHSQNPTGNPKSESKEENKVQDVKPQMAHADVPTSDMPKEVPEDVLKKVLN